jgi:plastocyanin
MRTRHLAVLAFLTGLLAAPSGAPAQELGTIRGRVVLGIEGTTFADVGPVVVYLESAPGNGTKPPAGPTPRVRQKDATFSPGFLAISAGQTVEMPNDDAIYHNVFSYSKPNDFDLGTYRAGESRSVTFRHPGVVRTYCSIHESMSGTIFVSPSPHFDEVADSGSFEIRGVPPGRHRLRTWCERLPDAVLDVEVAAGRTVDLELVVGRPAP